MLYAGSTLVLYGLIFNTASAIFIVDIFPKSDQEVLLFQKDLLSNSFLIIAAIGANIFAAAICSKVREDTKPIETGSKYEIQFTKVD